MAQSSAHVPTGVVSSLQGAAQVIRAGETQAHPLKVGDHVAKGDVILASASTQLLLQGTDGRTFSPFVVPDDDGRSAALRLAQIQENLTTAEVDLKGKSAKHLDAEQGKAKADGDDVDQAIAGVDAGDADAATAAGADGGGNGSLIAGDRVDRIIEVLTPQEFSLTTARAQAPLTAPQGSPFEQPEAAAAEPATPAGPPENRAPTAPAYQVTTDEDKPVSGKVQGTDPDGDNLVYSKGSDPAHGTVVVNPDGTWTYTPNKDYNGNDAFTVTVADGKGGTTTSTVSVGVTPVNDDPVVDPKSENYDPATGHYSAQTDEDTPVSGKVVATDADGDALSYTKGSNPAHGTVVVHADGTWTYTPSKDYNGSDSFTVTVSDGKGGTATATVDIGVNPVNDVPVVDPKSENYDPATGHYSAQTDEDTPVSGKVVATDADGDALSYAKGSNPAHGTVVVNADGTWTYTPSKDYNGSDSFTVTVSDGKGGTATATVDIGVNPVNDVPVVDPKSENYDPATGHYSAQTDEDTPVSGKVVATDADGDALSYAKGSNPTHGTVVVHADGTWTYTPSKDYNGSDSFTVTVSDGKGGTATATVDIGVNPVNDVPVVDPKSENYDPATGHYSAQTDEDTPVSGKVVATDADGDALSYAKGSNPTHGTVVVNADGTWTYTPNKDYNGSDSFTVTVSDGKGGTATATVDIGVNPVNDVPVVDPKSENYDPATGHYSAQTDEDTPVSGKVVATDADGDALSYAKGSNPAHGTVVVHADGTWTYTPSKDYNGSDSFTVTVSDGKGGTATATVDIGVNPVNDVPVVDPKSENYDPATGHYSAQTDEDTPVSGKVVATDADGDALSYAKGSNPTHGTVVVHADGTWTYTPSKDYNGSDSFTVTVSDGKGGTATATVDIGVNPVNDVPVVDPKSENYDPATGHYSAQTDEDTPVSGKVVATDADGDALSYTKGSNPTHGTVVVHADGTWTYTPSKDYNGSDSFTVTVSDGKGGTATATVDIGVNPVNDVPVVDPKSENYDPATGHYSAQTDEDTPVSGKVVATDADGDALSYAKGSNPTHGTVVVHADGTWTYTPSKDYNGSDSFTVTVSDGKGGTATATVDIGVNPVNDVPVVDPKSENYDPATGHYSAQTDEDTPVSGKVVATDADGDALSYAKGSNPAHGTVVVHADGTWTYTPSKDYNGADSFTVTVSDGKGGTATATIDIGIKPVNDAPVVDPKSDNYDPATGHYSAQTDEDKPVSGKVVATDADGDALSYTKGSNPAHGTVVVHADGTWTYTPSKDYNGADSFTVTVSDGKGGTATATVDIGIAPVNDKPVIDTHDDNYDPATGHYVVETKEDTPVNGKVVATDADGDKLSYAKGSNPAHGTVIVNADGTWTYTPSKDYNGADSFTVTVSDGKGGTATSTIDIGVTPVNDAPVITGQLSTTVSEEGLSGGNPDSNPNGSDVTNAREATGHLNVSDADGQTVSLTLSGPSGLTSGGVAITWSGNGTPGNPLVGSAGGKPILTATVDAQGDYKVTLQGPIDHADTTKEDVRTIDLQVKASDGTTTTQATLAVNVEDDSPLSGNQSVSVASSGGSQNTNLMLIIDTSGSMEDRLSDKTTAGLKAAIKNLIDNYDNLGDVKVQIVTFNDKAQGQAVWMTVKDAKAFIDKLTADGDTNYDAALATAKDAFAVSGKITGGVNVSYFITDGEPTKGHGVTNGNDETKWESFLTTNKIDSYAIGTGSLTSDKLGNIEPIAYNGISGKEQPAVSLPSNTELGKYLIDTVPTVKTGSLSVLAGADGLQKIESFSASGQLSSSLDANTKVLTIQLQGGGEMRVNMVTGEFTLTQPKDATDPTFSYTLVDKDGDRASGTVSLVPPNEAPQGTDHTATFNEDTSYTFKSGDFGFKDADAGDSLRAVRIDSTPLKGTLLLNGVAVTSGQVIATADLGKLVYTPPKDANGTDYAEFKFSVQDRAGAYDTTPRTMQLDVTPVNDAPDVHVATTGHNILGLIDLSVNPLLDLSKDQQVKVADVDNNLTRVDIKVDALFSLGTLLGDHSKLHVSLDPTLANGLHITGNDSRHLVIESDVPGGTIDVNQVNKLLATLTYDPADVLGLNLDLFPSMTVKATDAAGATDTQTVSSSIISVGLDVQPVVSAAEHLVSGHGDHSGHIGTDVFQWTLADRPSNGHGCVDTIHGFDGASRTSGGDVLDLRDLLSGEQGGVINGKADVGNLLSHLDFDTQSQPGNTVIHISANGGFQADASGNSHSDGVNNQQQIVLAGVDIRASLGLDAQANDHQIIAELMQRGKLLVDHS